MTKTLDAQFFGVPQRRRRVFIVGEKRKNGENPKFQFPDSCVSSTQKITVKSVIGHLPPPPENGKDHPAYPHHRKDRLSKINLDRLAALKSGEGMDHLPSHLVAKCHKIGSSVIGHRNVYGRMSWDNVAPTITARFDSFTRGQFGHPEQPRSITLREGALLQTFPEDFLFSGTKVEVASQIGNAVPPRLAEILGKQLIRYYDSKVNSSLSQ